MSTRSSDGPTSTWPDETYELGVLTRVAEMQPGDVVLTRIKGSDPTRTDGEDGTRATAHG